MQQPYNEAEWDNVQRVIIHPFTFRYRTNGELRAMIETLQSELELRSEGWVP